MENVSAYHMFLTLCHIPVSTCTLQLSGSNSTMSVNDNHVFCKRFMNQWLKIT